MVSHVSKEGIFVSFAMNSRLQEKDDYRSAAVPTME